MSPTLKTRPGVVERQRWIIIMYAYAWGKSIPSSRVSGRAPKGHEVLLAVRADGDVDSAIRMDRLWRLHSGSARVLVYTGRI
jgi:hypothetical protein